MQIKKSVMIVVLTALLIVPFASAGFFDFITGMAGSQNTNLTILVNNTAPNITLVNTTIQLDPNEANYTDYVFEVRVYDHDGSRDINTTNTTVNVNFTDYNSNFDEVARHATCGLPSTLDGKNVSFSCTVRFWYWDAAGFWNVSASVNDSSGDMAYNLTNVLTIRNLAAVQLSPSTITWQTLSPGLINQAAVDNSLLNNTGNLVFYTGGIDTLQINATNLSGSVNPIQIGAGLFKLGNNTAACSNNDVAVENTYINTTSYLGKGNLSIGSETAQEKIYYCLTEVPANLEKQSYATTEAWTLLVNDALGNN